MISHRYFILPGQPHVHQIEHKGEERVCTEKNYPVTKMVSIQKDPSSTLSVLVSPGTSQVLQIPERHKTYPKGQRKKKEKKDRKQGNPFDKVENLKLKVEGDRVVWKFLLNHMAKEK